MTSYPENFIPIVDAFERAFAVLAPGTPSMKGDPKDLSDDELDEFFRARDQAGGKVERLFRTALADGALVPWVSSAGQLQVLSDREDWRPAAFGIPGFESRTHHLTNPGPNDDREVFIERRNLDAWLSNHGAPTPERKKGRPPATDWEAIRLMLYAKCDEQGGVPSMAIGKGWRYQADAEKFVTDIIEARRENAVESVVRIHVARMLRGYGAKQAG